MGRDVVATLQSADPGFGARDAPDASALLDAWETGCSQAPARRALTLLAATSGPERREMVAGLTVGDRDRLLLDLREGLFGSRVTALAECPECGAALELDFDVDEVRTTPVTAGPVDVEADGTSVSVRLPTAGDLADAAESGDPAAVHEFLLHRCVGGRGRRAARGGPAAVGGPGGGCGPSRGGCRPAAGRAALALLRGVREGRGSPPFDIASFVWTEVDGWAVRSLREVHLLASAYGWTEAETWLLRLPGRQFYMAAVEA